MQTLTFGAEINISRFFDLRRAMGSKKYFLIIAELLLLLLLLAFGRFLPRFWPYPRFLRFLLRFLYIYI